MFTLKIADLTIAVSNRYPFTETLCREYIVPDGTPDFTVSATDAEIAAESDGDSYEIGYLESLALYRKIAEAALDYGAFLLHGVVADMRGTGIAFLAPSGVGKSTHALNWRRTFGEDFRVINGDKPLVRFLDGVLYAYGTPWAGKEGVQLNARTPLQKLCFIERAETNSAEALPAREIFDKLSCQVYLPKDSDKLIKTLDLVDRLIGCCAFYRIRCTKDESSALAAYEVLFS